MSSETPDAPGRSDDAFDGAAAPTVEYLPEERPARSGSRRWALIGAGTAGAVGMVAAGAWGVSSFMGGGTAPASAVPGDALAYLAVDLDPSGDQKLEAYRTLRKFPALREELGLEDGADLRRSIFDALAGSAGCDLDFERDIDPWLGSRMAVAAVPGEDEPVPFVVLQVDDPDAVGAGLSELATCGASGEELDRPREYGVSFAGDYAVVAETKALAEDVAGDAEAGSLEQDAEFERWVGEVGGSGIVTGYVAAEAPRLLLDAGLDGTGELDEPAREPLQQQLEHLRGLVDDFAGAAVVARFEGGALEVQSATGGLTEGGTGALLGLPSSSAEGDGGLSELPGTTAAAYGFAVGDTFVADLVEAFDELAGEQSVEEALAEAERGTGLELPEDLQTLLGDGVSLALDSSADVAGWTQGSGTDRIPAGVRITGDPDAIVPVVDKLLAVAGPEGGQVVVERGDGVVALGIDPEYVALLVQDGDLGDEQRFRDALPELSGSSGGVYVDFDAGQWLQQLLEGEPEAAELRENLEPLGSLGISSRVDDGVAHGLFRLTTD